MRVSRPELSRLYAAMLLVCLCMGLSACQSSDSNPTGGGGAVAAAADAPQFTAMITLVPSQPPRKGSTLRTQVVEAPARSEKTSKANPAPSSEASPSSETETPEFRLCSPLVDSPLADLRLIVSDPYRPPPEGSEARHHGMDFAYFHKFERAAIEGAGIQSVLDGQVAAAIVDSFPYGNMLIIETPLQALPATLRELIQISAGESLYVLYAHMERPPEARLGDSVRACQPLGAVGKSGNAGGAHLHLEARLGPAGTRFAGMGYYKAWASDEQRANYLLWRISGTYRHFDPMILLSY